MGPIARSAPQDNLHLENCLACGPTFPRAAMVMQALDLADKLP